MIDISKVDPFMLPSIAVGDRDNMPNISAVYFAISGERAILYVGKSVALRARWVSHNILDQLGEFAGVKVAWLSLDVLAGCLTQRGMEKELVRIEEAFIDLFKPPLNRTRLCIGVPKSTIEQVDEIMRITGMSKHEVFIMAFDRLHREVAK